MNNINITVEYPQENQKEALLSRLEILQEITNGYEELTKNQDFQARLSTLKTEVEALA